MNKIRTMLLQWIKKFIINQNSIKIKQLTELMLTRLEVCCLLPMRLTYLLSLRASSSYSNKIQLICKYPVSAPTPALMTTDEHSYHYSDIILHHIKNKQMSYCPNSLNFLLCIQILLQNVFESMSKYIIILLKTFP